MVVRVGDAERPAFQLRKGEEGISVFVPDAVQPPLTEEEILESFRPGSVVVTRNPQEIQIKGLEIIPVPGAEQLSQRLRDAHAEIRPGPGMTRKEFKQALTELE